MQDAWRAYLELALGLTEAPRKKAQTVARKLVGSGGATAAQLQTLVEEMVSTGLANREALTKIVRFEVDRAMAAVGLATAEEVAELTERVRRLERELRESKAGPVGTGTTPAATPPSPVAKKAVAKKAVAKKVVAPQPGGTVTGTSTSAGADVQASAPGNPADDRKLPVPAAKKTVARKRAAADGVDG